MFNVLIRFFSRYRMKVELMPIKTALFFMVLLWFSASGYLYFEMRAKPDLNWGDAFWWAIVTMTTVGYGDYFPESIAGRYIIGIPTMIFGIGLLGFILSEVASKLIDSKSRRLRGMAEHKLSGHIVIFNYHNLEKLLKLIDELKSDPSSTAKAICLVDETLEELPFELDKMDIHFIRGNPTREFVLNRACVADASHAIVMSKDPSDPHSDDMNLATILMIENLNPGIISVAECIDHEKIRQLKAAGCDRVVCIAPLITNLLVQEMQDPGIQGIIAEMTSNIVGQQLYLVSIEKMEKWTAGELTQWSIKNAMVFIGIYRDDRTYLNCDSDFPIKTGDRAIMIALSRPDDIRTV